MNLRDLKYIVAVAETKSFVKAAEQCFVSQPTLSMQIKKLENSLNIKIFERNNKHVLVTEIGKQVIETAKRILQDAEHISILAKHEQDPFAGDFTLGAFPTIAPYILPKLIPLIKKKLPNLRLILVEEKTDILLHKLKTGLIDAALLAGPIHDESLIAEKLFDDEFKLAVATHHPLAEQTIINPDELTNQPLLLLDEGHCLRDQALQFCQLSGIDEEQNVRATSLETLRQMVIADTGITFMPTIAIQNNDDNIRYIPFEEPKPKRTIYLVSRQTNPRTELIKQLKNLCVNNNQL
ncbi:MAG: LysR substrate-binding domain-containing protein [Cycloclasticus pugetii]|jgi:LysR family hydrogen peroxide-inducible transcriptional activator|uniref:Transcriptional regulator, LysR family n=1 Tax=Cycloclasticus zancles 78-ME TaxID=1198232 RepID=S5T4F2_9GAMM|nr:MULTISPECIES: LysR substrate-binding domain-containing protein [Cycloclasticus]AGS38691.1 Transcriptional regulator, LysR family [Cycloclasticus zancles 78-ME]MBV1898148.1 LysR family transcriptional regulator [Cycloclasticus sp.]